MGIDGIGKPPGATAPGAPAGVGGSAPVAPTGKSFEVEGTTAPSGAASVDALARLERGEIGVDQYLDLRVTEATRHLEGKLSSQELEFVKSTLREQLGTDPTLVELVRRATGGAP